MIRLSFKRLSFFFAFGVLFSAGAAVPKTLEIGDVLPEVTLVDQDGKSLALNETHGQATVLTFIFSRCPVATFCPQMSKNFSELQTAIRKDASLDGKVHLVSVSIDPDFDTPEVMKRYAEHFAIDTKDWSFVTGDPSEVARLASAFSVFIDASTEGMIDHTLTTALIGPDGKIQKLWRDNQWTPDTVLQELRNTLDRSRSTETAPFSPGTQQN